MSPLHRNVPVCFPHSRLAASNVLPANWGLMRRECSWHGRKRKSGGKARVFREPPRSGAAQRMGQRVRPDAAAEFRITICGTTGARNCSPKVGPRNSGPRTGEQCQCAQAIRCPKLSASKGGVARCRVKSGRSGQGPMRRRLGGLAKRARRRRPYRSPRSRIFSVSGIFPWKDAVVMTLSTTGFIESAAAASARPRLSLASNTGEDDAPLSLWLRC